jgi:hypothetical protein
MIHIQLQLQQEETLDLGLRWLAAVVAPYRACSALAYV